MILYAAYVKGHLVDQVAAETEDTALALLKMDFPDVKDEQVKFEIIDGSYKPTREQEKAVASVTKIQKVPGATAAPAIKVIEANEIHITINVMEGAISQEDIVELERASQEGMVIAKKKGT